MSGGRPEGYRKNVSWNTIQSLRVHKYEHMEKNSNYKIKEIAVAAW
jgi:hypothetical protein